MQKVLFFLCLTFFLACSPSGDKSTKDAGSTATATASVKKGTVTNIGLEEFDKMNGKYGVFVIDVRTPAEINEGKIRGAIDLDINSENFENNIAKMDREKSYILYCKSGGRSSRASDIMAEMGFQKVYNLEGGYTEWKKNNPDE